MCEFCQNFHPIKRIILNLETVRAAESHFYLASLQKKNEQERRRRRKRGRTGRRKRGRIEEKQSNENHPTHSKLNQEKKD